MASAAAVASSNTEALATAKPVKSRDHGLKVQQRGQSALTDLGLVRGVAGVPRWILQDIPFDHLGHASTSIATSNVASIHLIASGKFTQPCGELALGKSAISRRN